jgi:hypothetical protein
MQRHITKRGFNVSRSQIDSEWHPQRIETTTTPSSSQVGFGSYFTIDYKEIGVEVIDFCLQFNFSALSGTTSTHFVPSWFFVSRIEKVMNSKVIETYYPPDQFIQNQLYYEDEDRTFVNITAGAYQSTAQRIAMASVANSYYLPLKGFISRGETLPLLDVTHNVQFRVYMNSLENITAPAGAPVCTFNSCNLLTKVIKLRPDEIEARKNDIAKRPIHMKYPETRMMTTTIQSGVSSASVNLTGLGNGRYSHLLFVVRPSASLNNDSCYQFTPITSYALLDSSGANMVGGQVITHSQQLNMNKNNTLSTYTSENALTYLTDNKANVYMYSFVLIQLQL